MSRNSGVLLIHRKTREHWIWDCKKPEYFMWWFDILAEALYLPAKVTIRGAIVEIPRGSFRTSKVKLAARWKVDRRRVARFLKMLEDDRMIACFEDADGTTIKVNNYAVYQDFFKSKCTADGTADGTQNNELNKDNKKSSCPKSASPPAGRVEKIGGKRHYDHNSNHYKAAVWLKGKVESNSPRKMPPVTETQLQAWANDFRLLEEKDGISWDDIRVVLLWATEDAFWRTNILSAAAFRKNYAQLVAKMSQPKPNKQDIAIGRYEGYEEMGD